MFEQAALVAALTLGAALAWAATAKVIGWGMWRRALGAYHLGAGERAAAVGVPLVELITATVLVVVETKSGAAVTLLLVSAFSLTVLRARSMQGDRLPCGCFGGDTERDYRTMLLRNALLGSLAGIVLLSDIEGGALEHLALLRSTALLPAGLAVAGVGLAAWTATQVAKSFAVRPHRKA